MIKINIDNLTTTETELKLEQLNFSADSEDYLQELSEQEEAKIYGGGTEISCTIKKKF